MRRLLPTALVLMGIACLGPGFATVARADDAAERAEIDKGVDQSLALLYASVPGSDSLAKKAQGVLVFPDILKAGVGIGGEYGKGALRVQGKSVGYYSTAGASIGLQLGAEKHAMTVMFMTEDALRRFEQSSGWDAGADASVPPVDTAAGGSVETLELSKPVVAFVYGESGLMGNLSLEGTKISKLDLPADTATGSTTPPK
jgi:lipid-binding SYLF domain-containing protein